MRNDSAHESVKLTEQDLALLHALQINPRATWAQLGGLLGVTPSTVARRWSRLVDCGAAWVSCQPLSHADPALAVLEITCRPGRILDVAAELSTDPEAMTIDVTSGGRDLLITVTCADDLRLGEYLVERVSRVPHADSVRSHVVVSAYTDASRWRLRSLSPAEERAVVDTLPEVSDDARVRVVGDLDRSLVAALSTDGRRPVGELATLTGVSESTVRRRLKSLIASRVLRLRCEVARGLTGWRVLEWYFLRVPSDRLDEAGQTLAAVPEVRAILTAAGPFNLLVAAWLRSVADGQRLETQLRQLFPHVDVVDRSVVLRPYKLVGRLLDARGFATGVIPLELT